MGAAEEQRDETPLTPEELAELRELLPILRALKRLTRIAEVDGGAPKSVRPARRPPDAAYDKVDRLRKRKGIANE